MSENSIRLSAPKTTDKHNCCLKFLRRGFRQSPKPEMQPCSQPNPSPTLPDDMFSEDNVVIDKSPHPGATPIERPTLSIQSYSGRVSGKSFGNPTPNGRENCTPEIESIKLPNVSVVANISLTDHNRQMNNANNCGI